MPTNDTNTNDTNTDSLFGTFEEMLQGFGATLAVRSRGLSFGGDVLKLSADVKAVQGRVAIATDPRYLDMLGKLNTAAAAKVRILDATAVQPGKGKWHSRVRSNVNNAATSAEVDLTLTPIKLGKDTIGYSAHRA